MHRRDEHMKTTHPDRTSFHHSDADYQLQHPLLTVVDSEQLPPTGGSGRDAQFFTRLEVLQMDAQD